MPNINTDEDSNLRIERLAIVNLLGISTKLYFNIIATNCNPRLDNAILTQYVLSSWYYIV